MYNCAICGLEVCEDDRSCALAWNLDQFPEFEWDDEPDAYERLEEDLDV